jgi:hypothetical protein
MSLLLQQLLVAVLVAGCALFAAWRLATVRLRLRMLEMLGAWPGLRSASWLGRLREHARAQHLQACGGCGSAGSPPANRASVTRDEDARSRTPGALRR